MKFKAIVELYCNDELMFEKDFETIETDDSDIVRKAAKTGWDEISAKATQCIYTHFP